MLTRLVKLVEMLGVNSVPIVGVVAGEWSSATALSVYWAENLIASALVGARLWLHRRWTAQAVDDGTPRLGLAKAPVEFLVTAIPFTVVHGFMLVMVFSLVTKTGPDLVNLMQAVVVLLVLQGLAFGVDLWSLGDWPAHRVNERAEYLRGRVVLVHLSIIVGMFLFAWLNRPGAFFAFFVGCKVVSDMAQFLPRVSTTPGSVPPRWLSAVMRTFPKKDGLTFDEHWAHTHGQPRAPATHAASKPRAAPALPRRPRRR